MTQTQQRLRVSFAQCLECNVIAEYYYDLNASDFELAFTESCTKCHANADKLQKITVTKG